MIPRQHSANQTLPRHHQTPRHDTWQTPIGLACQVEVYQPITYSHVSSSSWSTTAAGQSHCDTWQFLSHQHVIRAALL
ncbi:hypothetical protein Scep_023528 [Stephania cephalantha]|uniref:Uncharacterized protein n=1 Tax=Stephania cephalantha TaxID=152367 RepID=A0AAP0F0B5_9MAGN